MSPKRPPVKYSRSASTAEIIVGEHLADLRGRVRFLTWVSGLCWTVVALFGGLLVTGFLDWLIHFDDSGIRLVVGLAVLSGSGWMLWRHLLSPLQQPLSGSFLATRVERRFPGLKNRVLSAVEFLEHRLDPKLGSAELQKAVVQQALGDLQKIDSSDIIETKAVRNVTIAGVAVFILVATVFALRPLEAATSVQRWMFPFSDVPWPRRFELRLIHQDLTPVNLTNDQPIRLARGDTLELYVENARGRLPDRVWFEHQIDDGTVLREPLRQTTLRDATGHTREAAVISWVAVRGTMQFRVTGGDDNVMPFHRVEVVIPPVLESLHVVVTPPPYSRRPVERLPDGVGHIIGLLGTKVEIVAAADKPLASAHLRIGEHPAVPLETGLDNRQLKATFEISDATVSSYWFELVDTQGFTDREATRYELRGIADGVPEVTIETPATDVLLTTDAELPVSILAKDDLGLRSVRISYGVNDDETQRTIPLFDRPSPTSSDEQTTQGTVTDDSLPLGPQQHVANYVWKMSDLNPEVGMRIVFRAEANDDYDLGSPHLGASVRRTITIVSREEKKKELASRAGGLLEDLEQATRQQQRARQQTQELQTQLENVGTLRPQDTDQLQRTELEQRQAASRLTHPADGVEIQARELLDELRSNRLDDAGTEQRLERLSNEIGRLGRDELPQAESALSRAQKLAEERADTPELKPLKAALDEAHAQQTRSLETLSELQDSLSEWRDRREVNRDLDLVVAEQEKIQQDSAEMAGQTMSKTSAEPTPQEKAELGKLADRQRKVAGQLEQFRKRLDQTAESVSKNDPEAAAKIVEAKKELAQKGTAGKLENAARNIAENRMGEATDDQQKAMDDLRDIERMMKRKPKEDTEQFLQQTQDALQEFRQLRDEQQQLADRAQDVSEQEDSLEKQKQLDELKLDQEELAERMAKAERKLERLRLRGPAQAAHRARKRLTEMMKHMQDADDGDEMQQAMDEALDDLEQVERELVLEKRMAQEKLAFEQLEKIEDELKSLRMRQEALIAETIRLDEARGEDGRITRGQKKSLLELAETERSLQHSAGQMAQRMASVEVFSLVLQRLARTLGLAANRLGADDTSAATLGLERDALRKLDSLLAVLKQEQKKQEKPQQPPEKPEELSDEPEERDEKPQDAQPPGDSIPQLAQLKLLKSLQEEYLDRTALLESFRDKSGKLPETMETEKQELAREQAELADFARNLVAKFMQQQPDRDPPDHKGAEPPKKKGQDKKPENDDDPAKIDL